MSTTIKRCCSVFLAIALCLAAFAGCERAAEEETTTQLQTTTESEKRISIVCAMFPQFDFARHIVGDRADAYLLLPPGADSHSYEPTPNEMIRITNSDVFIYIGDQMETWASSIIKTIDTEKTVVMNVSKSLNLNVDAHAHAHEHEHENEQETVDPHIWTNPVTAAQMVDVICDTISRADSSNADYYKANSDKYRNKILKLHSEISDIVSSARRNKIYFANEFALNNFVKQYGLEYMAAFDTCGDNAEASASRIAQIIKEIKQKNIPVIFYSELKDPREAKLISNETGAEGLLFHSCHNVSQTDFISGETYVSLMNKNAENLRIALNENVAEDGSTNDE